MILKTKKIIAKEFVVLIGTISISVLVLLVLAWRVSVNKSAISDIEHRMSQVIDEMVASGESEESIDQALKSYLSDRKELEESLIIKEFWAFWPLEEGTMGVELPFSLFLVYWIFLLVYPFRLLIMSLIWAYRVLRS